jgi:hypothetical protein
MPQTTHRFTIIVSVAALWLLTGCQSSRQTSTQSETSAAQPRLDATWIKPGLQRDNYRSLIVAPVNTGYLLDRAGWKAANPTNAELELVAQDLATFTRETFINAFAHDPNYRFALVNRAEPGAMILELAIVELVPSQAVLKAKDLNAPPGDVPGAKSDRSRVAIEGRFRDGVSGEVLMAFTRRNEPSMKIFDVKELTWWAFAQPSIREWAAQSVTLANAPPPATGSNEPDFRLRAW